VVGHLKFQRCRSIQSTDRSAWRSESTWWARIGVDAGDGAEGWSGTAAFVLFLFQKRTADLFGPIRW